MQTGFLRLFLVVKYEKNINFFVFNLDFQAKYADKYSMNSFTRSVDLLQRAMDVNTLRYQVSANNIAMAGVPNYKRQEVNFESELKRALDSEKDTGKSLQLTTTDERHIQLEQPYDYKSVEPRRVTDWTSTEKANGNNVNAETEAMNVMKIQLNYRMLAQLESFQFNQIKTAIKK